MLETSLLLLLAFCANPDDDVYDVVEMRFPSRLHGYREKCMQDGSCHAVKYYDVIGWTSERWRPVLKGDYWEIRITDNISLIEKTH